MSNRMRFLILGLTLIIAESNDQCPGEKFYDGWWEWAGIFVTPNENYKWIAQKVGGKYADPAMKLVVMSAEYGGNVTLKSHRTEAMKTADLNCTDVEHEGEMTPSDTACYTLKFNDDLRETVFTVKTAGASNLIFFAEHVPTEFEDALADDGKHYLKDSTGKDIEPTAQLPEGGLHGHGDGDAAGIGNDPYLKNCVCQAAALGWTLNCEAKEPVIAAAAYLEDNEAACASEDPPPTEECMKQYHIMQAHHDHCLHHDLPEDIEVHLHKFEKFYEDCIVKRQYDPTLPKCPEVTCTDEAALTAAVLDLNCDCETACPKKCADAMKTILMAHDTCPEEGLPTKLEVALHDHEDVCAAELCNSQATALFDPYDTPCAAEASAAIGLGSQEAFLATTLALPLAVFFSS